MKYMLMMITDEPAEAALSPADLEKIVAQHGVVVRELQEAGKLVCCSRLRFSHDAVTIRTRAGKPLVLDGPFAESKEQIGGFYLIEADSKQEAVAWAKKLPLREAGAIEVRPARTGAQWRGNNLPGAPRYLVMFVGNPEKPVSREAMFAAIDSHYELSLDLAVQGKFVGSRSLEPSPAATTLRWRNGKHVINDGPFAETKEFVAGYFEIASESKAEAIDWARQLMRGSEACEVRPLWSAE